MDYGGGCQPPSPPPLLWKDLLQEKGMLIIFTLICYEQNICNSNTNVDISKSKYSKNDNNDQYDEDNQSHDRGCLWKPDLAPSNLRFKHQPLHSFRHSAGVSQSEKRWRE